MLLSNVIFSLSSYSRIVEKSFIGCVKVWSIRYQTGFEDFFDVWNGTREWWV